MTDWETARAEIAARVRAHPEFPRLVRAYAVWVGHGSSRNVYSKRAGRKVAADQGWRTKGYPAARALTLVERILIDLDLQHAYRPNIVGEAADVIARRGAA